MNDEANKEVATLVFRASKLTAEALAEAMSEFNKSIGEKKKEIKNAQKMDKTKKVQEKPKKVKRGKMTLEELLKQNQGAVSIEIPRDGVGDFVKIAKKYHVDFAIKKSNETKPPTYMCFFKARDSDVLSAAFKDFIRHEEKKNNRPSFKKNLESAKEESRAKKENKRDKKRERTRSREKVL